MLRARSSTLILSLAVAVAVAVPLYGKGKFTEPVHGDFKLESAGRLSLENVNGYVHITTWDRNEVKVEGEKSASSQERLDDLDVHMDTDGDHVRIRTEFGHGRKWRDEDARIDFDITVPRGIRLDEVSLVNGQMSIKDVEGDVHASTVNGGLSATGLAGDVDLSTVNGALAVSFGRLDASASIHLHTVNGTVDVSIPRKAGARLSASTVNGAIHSDLGLTVSKMDFVGRSMKGTIGDGGASIDVDAVNGAIHIRGEDGEH
jgi:DUF4097 and DUF4098 domain-containing protein YvlB